MISAGEDILIFLLSRLCNFMQKNGDFEYSPVKLEFRDSLVFLCDIQDRADSDSFTSLRLGGKKLPILLFDIALITVFNGEYKRGICRHVKLHIDKALLGKLTVACLQSIFQEISQDDTKVCVLYREGI